MENELIYTPPSADHPYALYIQTDHKDKSDDGYRDSDVVIMGFRKPPVGSFACNPLKSLCIA